MTLPTVTLLLDDGTGTFPFDISRYLMADEGTSFNRGRADWQGAVTAGQLSLTLNNSDGRFTPGSTSIASPSPIKVDQRIRLRETVSGVTYTRFTGYVKSWPTQWPATVGTIAMSTITVTDAQARAERWALLPSWIQNEITVDSPSSYFPLGDAVGSTKAADFAGTGQLVVAGGGPALAFGATGPSAWATTALTLASGQSLIAPSPPGGGALAAGMTLECFFKVSSTLAATFSYALLVQASNATGSVDLGIRFDTSGKMYGFGTLGGFGTATSVSSANYVDGTWHHTALTYNNVTGALTLYVDGLSVATASAATGAARTLGIYGVGAFDLVAGTGDVSGAVGHVAFTPTTLSATRVLSHATTGLTGVPNESTDVRIARLGGYAGLVGGSVDAGLTTVPSQDPTGISDWEGIQAAADSEVGVAYINGSGTLDFHNRDKVRVKVTPDLTLAATSYVTPDVQPVIDDQQIVNYVEATSSVTGITQVVRNAASETAHGRYSDSQTYSVSTDTEALDRANWVVVNFAEPTTRYGTLTINLFAMPASLASSVLAAIDLDCWLRVVLMASQNPTGTTADVVVQGFTETCTADSWFITCNVVLRSLYNALILDNATYGVLDSSVARLGV